MSYVLRSALFLAIAATAVADELPEGVRNSQNPADVSLTPQESLSRIRVPEGFSVTLFAGEPHIRRPIAFDFDDRGRLWVVENYSHPHWKAENTTDRVIILEDSNHDGEFDKRTVFWDKGRYLTGIAYGHGGVWLANTPELIFLPDRDRDDVPDSEPEVMLDGFQISTNNVVNNFHWGPDGWLYGAIGLSATSKVGKPGAPATERTPITRGIWRFHPVSHRFEKVAEGMVNPWGADFNEFGDLFTSNTVIAHLWHIVPGMYCERRAGERDNPFAYDRIQSIANHLHWGGGNWQSSRNPSSRRTKKPDATADHDPADHERDEEYQRHSVSGGGHAHCGAMIYLGDSWPKEYQGAFFTNNLHGNRVNVDLLIPKRSTYVGEHDDDFLFGNDPWFRGMSIKYGPDGGVYVSDWHDYGECHDSDGSHRTSGRIYKVTYADTPRRTIDLQQLSNLELVKLQSHVNEWFVRHARRILHERHARGEDTTEARDALTAVVESSADELIRLRTLWALQPLDDQELCERLLVRGDESEHIRRWALRLVTDKSDCDMRFAAGVERKWVSDDLLQHLLRLAESDSSAKVRLELASVLQRVAPQKRLELASRLLSHAGDATDPYIPMMIWYGLEPAIADRVTEALRIASRSRIPIIQKYIARRIADMPSPPLEQIVEYVLTVDEQAASELLSGMAASLDQRPVQEAPASWSRLCDQLKAAESTELRSMLLKISLLFGDKNVIASMQKIVLDRTGSMADRRDALGSLLSIDNGLTAEQLHAIAETDAELRSKALIGLLKSSNDQTANVLLQMYGKLTAEEKNTAIAVLVTSKQFADDLLVAIDSGVVARDDVSAFALQQLKSFRDGELQQHVAKIWGDDNSLARRAGEIARLKKAMSPGYLQAGNASIGRAIFDRTCAKCHSLFGEGGNIGPSLTGSGRKDPDYVIRNLVDPDEQIDPAYRQTTVFTNNGRLFNGYILRQDDRALVIRTQDATVRLAMKDIDEVSTSSVSMMPQGMLNVLTDEQIRDLLVYLAGEDQVSPEPTSESR